MYHLPRNYSWAYGLKKDFRLLLTSPVLLLTPREYRQHCALITATIILLSVSQFTHSTHFLHSVHVRTVPKCKLLGIIVSGHFTGWMFFLSHNKQWRSIEGFYQESIIAVEMATVGCHDLTFLPEWLKGYWTISRSLMLISLFLLRFSLLVNTSFSFSFFFSFPLLLLIPGLFIVFFWGVGISDEY